MDGVVWFRTPPTTSRQRTTSFAPAIACINHSIPGRGRTRCTGENPSCDGVIADMSGRRAFFAFQARNGQGVVSSIPMPYTAGEGASHDAVEQDLYDQDIAADHFCTDRHGHYEGGKFK